MMENYSLSDIRAATGNEGGFGNMMGDGLIWLVVLFLFGFGGNGFGQHGFGGAATAAAQNEILLGQNFDRVGQKLDGISQGLCNGFYAINDSIKECCCNTQLLGKDIIAHGDQNTAGIVSAMTAGFQRVIDNQNGIEMQHLRDAQMRDYLDKSLCGIVRYPLAMTYSTNYNPFCGSQCGCGNGYQANI